MYFFIRNRKKISIPRSVIGVIPFERLVHIFQSCQYVWKMHSVDEKLAALNQISQKKFLNILEKISGKKDLIIDPYLLKPLEHVVGAGKLRGVMQRLGNPDLCLEVNRSAITCATGEGFHVHEVSKKPDLNWSHGVDKIYKLEKTPTPFTNTQRVFFIQGDLITVKNVCDKINSELSQQNDGNSYHLIIIHRVLGVATHLLEEEGVYGYATTYCFQWELIRLDDRVLSLEFNNFFKTLFVEGDQSYLPSVAKSIWTLQMIFGRPQTTVVLGKYSHYVQNMMEIYFNERGIPTREGSDISCFVIIDRDVDYSSVLLTGGTYSCLLDEVFGIKSGYVEVKSQTDHSAKKNQNQQAQQSYYLSPSDKIYSQIKNRHFSDVFIYLSAKTKELSSDSQRRQNMSVTEMKRYVSKELSDVVKLNKTLAYHIAACEAIVSDMGQRFENLQETEQNIIACRNRKECTTYIEDCIVMSSNSKYSILRLMCLLSLTQDGLTPDEYQRLRMQFLHAYGYRNLPCFMKLEKAGLCTEQQGFITEVKGAQLANKVVQAVSLPTRKTSFQVFSQKLKLFPEITDDYDLKNPKDPGYVFGGSYIPVACQLVHHLIKEEISQDELKKIIPNLTISNRGVSPLRTFVVYIVGGVTYSEISAFQLIERLTGAKIIVASTSVINGNLLVKSFL